jgi:hypothetical protein
MKPILVVTCGLWGGALAFAPGARAPPARLARSARRRHSRLQICDSAAFARNTDLRIDVEQVVRRGLPASGPQPALQHGPGVLESAPACGEAMPPGGRDNALFGAGKRRGWTPGRRRAGARRDNHTGTAYNSACAGTAFGEAQTLNLGPRL